MVKDQWFETLEETLATQGLKPYSLPLKIDNDSMDTIKVHPFGPYQDEDEKWQFSTGLYFEVPKNSDARWLYAITTGSMEYREGTAGDSGTIILTRLDVNGRILTQAMGALPYWYPEPAYIIYENINPKDACNAAVQVLKRTGEKARVLSRVRKAKGNTSFKASNIKLAQMWLRGEIPGGISVIGGDPIGGCTFKSSSDSNLFGEIRLVERLNPAPGIFYNLAYYFAQWDAMELLKGNKLLLKKLADTGGPPMASGRMLFVRKSGSAEAPFDTPAKASTTISAAVAASSFGETILILDLNLYLEELIIEKAISIVSTGEKSVLETVVDYPILRGPGGIRPVIFRNVSSGIAHIGKLEIDGGVAEIGRADGGGILVEKTNNVVISNCVIKECRALGGGVFGQGFGGGISAYHASPAIVGCLIKENRANSRGSGIGVYGYGWPAIFDCTIRNNKPMAGDRNPRPDGGAIGITVAVPNTEDVSVLLETTRETLSTRFNKSDLKLARQNYVRITRCNIRENEAWDDGGGIYVSVGSQVFIRSTQFVDNHARGNGGGLRITFASTVHLIDCSFINNQSNFNRVPLDTKGTGGGAIAARNARLVRLKNSIVQFNVANGWAGGGVYFITSDAGPLPSEGGGASVGLDFDFNDFLWDKDVYNYVDSWLKIDSSCDFSGNEATQLAGQNNHGKGGAIYVLRWKGFRGSGIVIPDEPGVPRPILKGRLINVYIENSDVLKSNNNASFSNTNRLYLEDRVLTTEGIIQTDGALWSDARFTFP